MTLEQIVAQHPCPIIRGKIMENVNKKRTYAKLDEIIWDGFIWYISPEGTKFWDSVSFNLASPYSDLKHLDLSYVPEPAKPPVMWRKIDKDKLPTDEVIATKKGTTFFYLGEISEDKSGVYVFYGNGLCEYDITHYIPLSDLINLPIED